VTTSTTNSTATKTTSARRDDAEVAREYVPFPDRAQIHGVTFDGRLVWFARDGELVAFDPEADRVVRRLPVPHADSGTAFDGEHLYQLAKGEVLVIAPEDGRIVRRFRAPEDGLSSGMAWADGYLFIGQFRESRIHKVDAKTGEVVKTLASDRFVTGVSCVDGALWHAVSYDGKPPELRRLAADGAVEETLSVPVAGLSGIERTPSGDFFCGGDQGTLRVVRKKGS
jgi:outer membrane protein assembly factor BamB